MASRRMISKVFVESDSFSELSNDAKLLYHYLNTYADDDGFVNQRKNIMRQLSLTEDAFIELLDNGFILDFPGTNVFVLTHWKINNEIKKDRYHPTNYQEQWQMIRVNRNSIYERIALGEAQEKPTSVHLDSAADDSSGVQVAHGTLMTLLTQHGLNVGTANQLINVYGDEKVYKGFRRWLDDGKKGSITAFFADV